MQPSDVWGKRDRCLRILGVLRTQNGYDGSGIHLILQNILAPTC